ncbi:HDAC6 [Blepharisma stoltei]|uniref:histone deacetylase n=1 Tax=Blepharisma stoltei TaxID=1481888 RepID=A0AAU9JMA5_9CILI|nr:unnamed protein product [Blepharisma stoltei]
MEDLLSSLSIYNKVGYVYNPALLQHRDNPYEEHVEKPDRIEAVHSNLDAEGVLPKLISIPATEAPQEEINKVHSSVHCEKMQSIILQPGKENKKAKYSLNPDCYNNFYTYECAHLACGGMLNAVKEVASGNISSAFANIRPPGHHAKIDDVGGFCFINNVAVAAKHAISSLGIRKVFILDWDVHHGNGTQDIFKADPNVLAVSLHRYDNGDFWPNEATSAETFIGVEEGRGFNINVAWNTENGAKKSQFGDNEYKYAFDNLIFPVAKEFDPDLVLIACGFDAMRNDPLGKMALSPEIYGYMTNKVMELAGGKVVAALEGGYNLKNLRAGSKAVVSALLGEEVKSSGYDECCDLAKQCVEASMKSVNEYWTLN